MGIKTVVIGAAGKMGRNIINAVSKNQELELSGAVELAGSQFIGNDSGELAGIGKNGIQIKDNLEEVIQNSEVSIDFTSPESTLSNIKINLKYNKPAVIGTTGFSDKQMDKIREAGKQIPILISPNMSIGVNLLFKLTEITTKTLSNNYDIEIVEAHHRFKKDAPSGTAKKLGEIIKGNSDITKTIYGRDGMIGERKSDELAILSVRAGDIVGDHTVIFGGIGERIELTHRAHSRMTFAQGAVKATLFIVKQKPGIYSMQDVLNLR